MKWRKRVSKRLWNRAQILNSLNIKQIKLMTSGVKSTLLFGLQGFGLEIVEEIQIECKIHSININSVLQHDFY